MGKGMKILVIDNFSTMRKIVRDILKKVGYENIEEAVDGADAYSKLKEGGYDFVISSWNLPSVSGLELIRKMRSDAELARTPILMLTSEDEKDKIIEAVKSGEMHYMKKPFTAEELKEKITAIMEQP